MSLIIIPVLRSAASSHMFETVSASGRRMLVTVEAPTDITSEAVRADLEASLSGISASSLAYSIDEQASPAYNALMALLVWIAFLVFGGFLLMLLDMAGFRIFGNYAYTLPSTWIGVLADQSVGTALLRVHLGLLPIVLVGACVLALARKQKRK